MSTVDLGLILDRIAYSPEQTELSEIPWPDGMAPAEAATALQFDGSLPTCDAVAITYTVAEAETLANVLTPGAPSKGWTAYAKNWDAFAKQLTSRSPARESKRLASFHMATIAGMSVCCMKSELHPATDGPTLPLAALSTQIAKETGAKLFITTGTAGGAGNGTVLGDLNIASQVASDFSTRLKGHPWSQETWGTSVLSAKQKEMLGPSVLPDLLNANAKGLPKEYAPRLPQAWYGETVSTDFFAFADKTDHYGLLAKYPTIRTVEMDDAACALGVLGMDNPPAFASVRNASDPVMATASAADAKLAESIYERWGALTTVSSAIGCWALIAGLAQE